MTTYTIVPRNREYWIEAIAEDGSRELVERFDSEDKAVQRLRKLKPSIQDVIKRNAERDPR
jgi:hypothetical protein